MVVRFELLPLVDMDGILTEEERRRIIRRLHSMLAWVGSIIPEKEVIYGERIELRKIVLELVSKPKLTREDLKKAKILARGIAEREKDIEEEIIHGDITEEEALSLLEEARGLLRALEDLKALQDKDKAINAKEIIMSRVDDEKRWKKFLDRIKKA